MRLDRKTLKDFNPYPLPVGKAQVLYFDDELKGFGLRVTAERMTWVAQSRVKGRTVRVTLGQYSRLTPDMARKEARIALGEMDRGIDRNRIEKAERRRSVTLDEAFTAYMTAKRLAPNTLHDYHRAMDGPFARWADMPIVKITGGMVSGLFDAESARGATQANRSFRFLRALLGWSMWKYSHEDGTPLIASNPCAIVTKLKGWNPFVRRKTFVTGEQLPAFFGAIAHERDDSDGRRSAKDLCVLLLMTGLRDQEGCGLLWADVGLGSRIVTVRNTKNGSDHTLPIGTWLAARLAARKLITGKSEYVFPADNCTGHLVFHWKHIQSISKAAGFKFTLHDLRRTFISIVNNELENVVSAYTMKRLISHSPSADVTEGYIQIPVAKLRRPMEMVEEFVLRTAGVLHTRSQEQNASDQPAELETA